MNKLQALVLLAFVIVWHSTAAFADIHFDACYARTGNNATVIIPADVIELDGAPLDFHDEVAVFTPEGVCAGRLAWDGANAALAVWEDDPSTEAIEGFRPGDLMNYVVWDASTHTEYGRGVGGVQVTYDTAFNNESVFLSDAVYLVSEMTFFSVVSGEAGPTEAFALDTNFPNPFSNRTTIRYGLQEDARVKLEVYDLLGHRVSVLVDGYMAAGRHEVDVVAGSDWSSGVYVYRLQAGRFSSHRKMILVN